MKSKKVNEEIADIVKRTISDLVKIKNDIEITPEKIAEIINKLEEIG